MGLNQGKFEQIMVHIFKYTSLSADKVSYLSDYFKCALILVAVVSQCFTFGRKKDLAECSRGLTQQTKRKRN